MSEIGNVVCVFDTEAMQEVFAADGIAAHAGEANKVIAPVIGSRSILTIDRDEHLARRKAISPSFHGQSLELLQPELEKIVDEEEGRWTSSEPFALRPAFQRITFRMIALIALGQRDKQRVERLLDLFERLVSINPIAAHPLLRIDAGRWTPWGRFLWVQRQLDEELHEIISERRRQPRSGNLLDLIVQEAGGDSQQARDELMALLLAGHETTATALAWAFERLARNPKALADARKAAIDGDLGYLDAVGSETLRARPILSDAGRVLDRPFSIGEYLLPAGTVLRLSIALVQSDPEHHSQPEEFRPERFLGKRPDPRTWLPFGGGRRRCLGAALAQLEMRTVLRRVLMRRTLLAPDSRDERPTLRGVTFVPDRDAFLQLPLRGGEP